MLFTFGLTKLFVVMSYKFYLQAENSNLLTLLTSVLLLVNDGAREEVAGTTEGSDREERSD